MRNQRPFSRIAAALVVGILLFPVAVSAGTLYTQDTQDVQSTAVAGYWHQQLGTGLTGTVASIVFKIHSTALTADPSQFSSGSYYFAYLWECPDNLYFNCSNTGLRFDPYFGYNGGSASTTLGGDDYLFRFNNLNAAFNGPGTHTLNPAAYYFIAISHQETDTLYGGTNKYAGSLLFQNSNSSDFFYAKSEPHNQTGTPDPNISEMAFRLCDTTACDLTPADTEAPVIAGTPSDIVAEATSTAGASVTYTPPTRRATLPQVLLWLGYTTRLRRYSPILRRTLSSKLPRQAPPFLTHPPQRPTLSTAPLP